MAVTTVTVPTVQPGLVAVFRRFVAVFLTDWVQTLRYSEGTVFISITPRNASSSSSSSSCTFIMHLLLKRLSNRRVKLTRNTVVIISISTTVILLIAVEVVLL